MGPIPPDETVMMMMMMILASGQARDPGFRAGWRPESRGSYVSSRGDEEMCPMGPIDVGMH